MYSEIDVVACTGPPCVRNIRLIKECIQLMSVVTVTKTDRESKHGIVMSKIFLPLRAVHRRGLVVLVRIA